MRKKLIKWSPERDKNEKENLVRGGVTCFSTATLTLQETGVSSDIFEAHPYDMSLKCELGILYPAKLTTCIKSTDKLFLRARFRRIWFP